MTPLTLLPRRLADETGRPAPSYRQCYNAVLNGAVPAVRVNGRWFVRDEDVAAAAAALGLAEPQMADAA